LGCGVASKVGIAAAVPAPQIASSAWSGVLGSVRQAAVARPGLSVSQTISNLPSVRRSTRNSAAGATRWAIMRRAARLALLRTVKLRLSAIGKLRC